MVSPSLRAAMGPRWADSGEKWPAMRPRGAQGDGFAQALSDECGGNADHLAHPGTALGTFVPDHHDVSLVYLPVRRRLHRFLLGVEDAPGALVEEPGVAGALHDAG